MEKKRAALNILIGIIFKVIILLLTVVTRSFVVKYIGDEANGLYSLYISIIGFLTIANLGVGSAITYSMYKPIVENNSDEVSALYYLFKKFYIIVFFVILALGLAIMPFVPKLATGSTNDKSTMITYLIFLISVSITYLYGHKISTINAYKDNYITTLTVSISLILEGIIQIIVLVLTRSFIWFLMIRIFAYTFEGLLIELIFRIKILPKLNKNKIISKGTKKELIKNASAKMYSQIGFKLVTSLDNVIISFFITVVALANYSNYVSVASGLIAVLGLVFSEITSILGHLSVRQSKESIYAKFKKSYAINFLIGILFFLGFVAISSNIIEIMFTKQHLQPNKLVYIIGVYYFIEFMRGSTNLFKNALGIFYPDRHRSIVEGIVNLVLSIIFVNIIGIEGVLIATIIVRLFISYPIETKVLFKHGFGRSMKNYSLYLYGTVLFFVFAVIIFTLIPKPNISSIHLTLLFNGVLSVIVYTALMLIVYIVYTPFKNIVNELFFEVKSFKKELSRGNE